MMRMRRSPISRCSPSCWSKLMLLTHSIHIIRIRTSTKTWRSLYCSGFRLNLLPTRSHHSFTRELLSAEGRRGMFDVDDDQVGCASKGFGDVDAAKSNSPETAGWQPSKPRSEKSVVVFILSAERRI